jgi:hypothetical protein
MTTKSAAPKKKTSLPVFTNLDTARFKCVYPSCGGLCCRQSRPPVEPAEAKRIADNLHRVIDHMRPSARRAVEKNGFLTKRIKSKRQMISINDEYCVFYNEGCVLHRLGAGEGDSTKYKPWVCIAFPLDTAAKSKGETDEKWEVRQWGNKGEAWDLFCLNPKEANVLPRKSLAFEIDFVRSLDGPKHRWRFKK